MLHTCQVCQLPCKPGFLLAQSWHQHQAALPTLLSHVVSFHIEAHPARQTIVWQAVVITPNPMLKGSAECSLPSTFQCQMSTAEPG